MPAAAAPAQLRCGMAPRLHMSAADAARDRSMLGALQPSHPCALRPGPSLLALSNPPNRVFPADRMMDQYPPDRNDEHSVMALPSLA